MAMGKRQRHAKQAAMWVATEDLPRSAAHPFYARLNQILDQRDFDGFAEGLCARFYADEGRPGLPPGCYFRLLLIGYWSRKSVLSTLSTVELGTEPDARRPACR
jgi:transposase